MVDDAPAMNRATTPLPAWLGPAQWPPKLRSARASASPPHDALLRITVVTPSYNQAAFLETTIRSVLDQGYPALDYHVIDGGSRDGSVEILQHYAPWLTSWVSERDRGQVDAILKGLARAEGEWFNWINSDDLLAPGALWEVARLAPGADLIGGSTQNFRAEALDRLRVSRALTARDLVRLPIESRTRWHQPGIWYRTQALRETGIDAALHYRFDLDLLIRYTQRFPRVQYSDRTLAWFRLHGASKSLAEAERFGDEHRRLLQRLIDDPETAALRDDAREALAALDWRLTLQALSAPTAARRGDRLSAFFSAARRTPGAWRRQATWETLGRLLRPPKR